MRDMTLKPFWNYDASGTVCNGEATYKTIALMIGDYFPVYIAWTDEEGTQYDILFCIAQTIGPIQRGIRSGELYVSVQGYSTWAWEINDQEIHPSYMCEKLRMHRGPDTDKLAELITGVRRELYNIEQLCN